jgi:DNA repair protein RadC
MKTIKDLPEHSRPREKLREKGASALTDEELVAAIPGMGLAKTFGIRTGPRNLLKDTFRANNCMVIAYDCMVKANI